MERQRYNRLKAANERVQSVVHLDSAEREQARRFSSTARRGKSTQFKIVLAEKERTGTWLSEQMGHNFFDKRVQSRTRSSYAERRKSRTQFNICTVSRWMTNRSALPLARARTLRDCTPPRCGCERLTDFNKIRIHNTKLYKTVIQ